MIFHALHCPPTARGGSFHNAALCVRARSCGASAAAASAGEYSPAAARATDARAPLAPPDASCAARCTRTRAIRRPCTATPTAASRHRRSLTRAPSSVRACTLGGGARRTRSALLCGTHGGWRRREEDSAAAGPAGAEARSPARTHVRWGRPGRWRALTAPLWPRRLRSATDTECQASPPTRSLRKRRACARGVKVRANALNPSPAHVHMCSPGVPMEAKRSTCHFCGAALLRSGPESRRGGHSACVRAGRGQPAAASSEKLNRHCANVYCDKSAGQVCP
jgi:hypothetical protein